MTKATVRTALPGPAPAVLVLTVPPAERDEEKEREIELRSLMDTAHRAVAATLTQHLARSVAATRIGSGKVDELAALVASSGAGEVVFDCQLTPSQQRNLEAATKVKVLDYDELILEIFALNARTHQARLAVELARLEYAKSRLKRLWSHLDRQSFAGAVTGASGAVGGVGEKQIELDRRQIRDRIVSLRRELLEVAARKDRAVEARTGCFNICLVGYTNAGKSTLMNTLTSAGVLAEDRLFATLDTRSSRLRLDAVGRAIDVVLSDTVGFIRNLPPQLIASFHATLAEVREADLLLHVADCSRDVMEQQIAAVESVLAQIGCGGIPQIMVFNKADAIWSKTLVATARKRHKRSAVVSARTGAGLDELKALIATEALKRTTRATIRFPAADGALAAHIRANAAINRESYDGSTAVLDITADDAVIAALDGRVVVVAR